MKLLELINSSTMQEEQKHEIVAIAQKTVANYQNKVDQLQIKIDNLQTELKNLYLFTEKDFDSFSSNLVGYINSPDNYFTAQAIYNVEWFKNLPYSLDKKIQIAQMLIDTVNGYNSSYTASLWHSIVNKDYEVLQSIRFWQAGVPGNIMCNGDF